ncbi:hypothetical protein HN011_002161 [Eciton burchellii]|nr:hypothetical protein HN011_002161 [Eciton burchellii]
MPDFDFPAAEKILCDLENMIKRNPSIRSFMVVPMEDNENRSPVLHQEDSLALGSWCVEPLHLYTYRRVMDYRRERHHRREDSRTIARWLLGSLLFAPNITTFWNMRRELVRAGRLDVREELSLTRPVLYNTPKTFEAFSYRSWLMPLALDAEQADVAQRPESGTSAIVSAELELAETCADRYANNYHAWCYRRHLVTLCESRGLRHPSVESEWTSTLAWCWRHVSDHSAYSYRQFLLRKCVLAAAKAATVLPTETDSNVRHDEERHKREDKLFLYMSLHISESNQAILDRMRQIMSEDHRHGYSIIDAHKLRCYLTALSYWAEECSTNDQLLTMYCEHETLWYHRRFLAHTLALLALMYLKHACYREDDFLDNQSRRYQWLAPLFQETHADEDNDPLITVHSMIIQTFRATNMKLFGMTFKRHEKTYIQRYFEHVAIVGLQ